MRNSIDKLFNRYTLQEVPRNQVLSTYNMQETIAEAQTLPRDGPEHLQPSPKMPPLDFTVGQRHTHRHHHIDAHLRRLIMMRDSEVDSVGGFLGVSGLTGSTVGNTVVLLWNAVQGAASYKIYRGTVSGGETLLHTGNTTTTYTDNTSLVHNTIYFYKVTAVIGGQETALMGAIEVPVRYTGA
jgi:hypothetical protein